MKAWLVAIIGLGCLTAAGCSGNAKQAILALEQENRQLEDMVFQQQGELQRAQRELEACRGRGAAVPSGAVRVAPPPAIAAPVRPGAPDTSRPPLTVELPSTPTTQLPDTLKQSEAPRFSGGKDGGKLNQTPSVQLPETPEGAPRLDIPQPLPTEQRRPQPLRTPGEEIIPAPAPENGSGSRGGTSSAASARVAEIALNDNLTGGCQTDPRQGDRGIVVVVEPRDAHGRLVETPAAVSVVVLDPALEGQAARVARWDFTAQQLASLHRKGAWGEGYHLEMLWPGAAPVHENLQLFVRYVTSDGRKLETQRKIRVATAGSGDADRTANRRGTPSASVAPSWQQRPATPAPDAAEPMRLSSRLASPTAPISARAPAPAPEVPRVARPTWSPERR
jgi:hypothetical protein